MPVNAFSTGRDISVDIVTAQGVVSFRNFTEFSSRQTKKKTKSDRIDGVVSHIWIPGGWEGEMMYDRTDPTLDNYFAQEEAIYYNGQPINAITIIETITENTGAQSQYRYDGVQMEVSDAGKWRGDDKVPQQINWAASTRTQLS